MTPCNFHLRALAEKVKEGVRAAGGTPIEFDTITISDGITMGTEGMKASLISREVIADSIELFVRAHAFDAVVAICGCDKTIPGTVMALARLESPFAFALRRLDHARPLPRPRRHHSGRVRGRRRLRRRQNDRKRSRANSKTAPVPARAPAAANSPRTPWPPRSPFSAFLPWARTKFPPSIPQKAQVAFDCGKLVMDLLKKDIRPKQIITHASLRNAIASVAATGGSTNAVLHLLAIARDAGVPLTLEEFDKISAKTPILTDLKPGGRFVAPDMYRAGGMRLLGKYLQEAGLLHDGPTASGKNLFEEIAERARKRPGRK